VPGLRGSVCFINADLIAAGLSPFEPQLAAMAAGCLVISELTRLVAAREHFAFESTLSGLGYAKNIEARRKSGYHIEIAFLQLASPKVALRRIANRVRQNEHNVPREDVVRRFTRGRDNFENVYKLLANAWTIYDNSGQMPHLTDRGPVKDRKVSKRADALAAEVGAALRHAAHDARRTARMYGTPIYVWENWKVVVKKPREA
jgi:predicted ABC-type ATPase